MGDTVEVLDAAGAPALADVEAVKEVTTRSGNPGHGARSGKFKRPVRPGEHRGAPSSAAVGSERRRRDAVVDAARSLTDLSPDGVREFVVRRWRGTRALSNDDVDSFARDASEQRMHDLVDALDNRLHRLGNGKSKAAQVVRVTPPRAWLKRTLAALPDNELGQVLTRLRARGWSETQISRDVLRPYVADRKIEIPKLALADEDFSIESL